MLPGNMAQKGLPCVSPIAMMIHTFITTTGHTVCVQRALAPNKNKDYGTRLNLGLTFWLMLSVWMAVRQLIGFRTHCLYQQIRADVPSACLSCTSQRGRGKKRETLSVMPHSIFTYDFLWKTRREYLALCAFRHSLRLVSWQKCAFGGRCRLAPVPQEELLSLTLLWLGPVMHY